MTFDEWCKHPDREGTFTNWKMVWDAAQLAMRERCEEAAMLQSPPKFGERYSIRLKIKQAIQRLEPQ